MAVPVQGSGWDVISTNYVSAKLIGKRNSNYKSWKAGMIWLMESQESMDFINIPRPQPQAEVVEQAAEMDDEDLNPPLAQAQAQAQAHTDWIKKDRAVKGWILDALSDEVSVSEANKRDGDGSARDLWLELENIFSPAAHDDQERDGNDYLALHRAAVEGNWDDALNIMDADHTAVDAKLTSSLGTVLHVAVASGKSKTFTFLENQVNRIRASHHEQVTFVQNLVNHIGPLQNSMSIFMMTDSLGHNALHIAAMMGNISAARELVAKSCDLLYVPSRQGHYPVHLAADEAHRETLLFLLKNTKHNSQGRQRNPYAGLSGALLLTYVIDAKFYDIATQMVNKYPDMARLNVPYRGSALMRLARQKTLLFKPKDGGAGADIFKDDEVAVETAADVENQTAQPAAEDENQIALLACEQPRSLVKLICEKMSTLKQSEASDIFEDAILTAATSGNAEVVEEIVATFPDAVFSRDVSTEQIFLHVAIQNRRENVYNLIYQAGSHRYHYADFTDVDGNTMLHMAAALAPSQRLNSVPGAALQMQRELQWFEEVEKFVSPYSKTLENKAGKTADMVFTEEHRDLKEEGEKWMKDTANSCTIAAALIATVVFAAAITVPGGNQSDTGRPMFLKSGAFTVFAVADAVSLFTSTTSLLMFLSILTSRYAEEDFLRALPKRLCIGLVTLFLSILSMMVAFYWTLYIVFGWNLARFLIPVVIFPVVSFLWLQFPLLLAVVSSTYGRGIFGKQSDRPFH